MSKAEMSNAAAVCTIIVSTLGSGITLMPAVYSTLGTTNATLVMGFIGLITYISLYSLAYSAKMTDFKESANRKEVSEEKSSYSYEGIAASFSSKLKFAVAMTLVISSLATALSFVQAVLTLLFQALNFNETFATFFDAEKFPTRLFLVKLAIIAALALIYFPLFKLDSLSSLDFFSKLSLGTALLFSCVIFGYRIFAPFKEDAFLSVADKIKDALEGKAISKMSIGTALGSVIFALHCQFSFPEILSSMENQSLSNFTKTTLIATALATILYSAVGYFGYLAFGEAVADNTVIVSFGDKKSPLAIYLAGAFGEGLGVYVPRIIQTVYILIFFSGNLFNLFSIIPILQKAFAFKGKEASRNSIALLMTLFIFVSGLVTVDDLAMLFGFIGFLFVTPLSFLYPSLFVVLSTKRINIFKLVSYAMILLSLAIMIGLFLTTMKFVEF